MRRSGRLSQCRATWVGRLLSPLLWVRHYLESLKDAVLAMIWRELIHDAPESSEVVNLVAFLFFSALSLVAYRSATIPYLSTALLLLWPLGWIETRLGWRRRPGPTVALDLAGDPIRWRSGAGAGDRGREAEIPRAEVKQILIRRLVCPNRQAGHLGWQLSLSTRGGGEWPVQVIGDLGDAWRRAIPLARGLQRPLTLLESMGAGWGAEMQSRPVLAPGEDRFWRRTPGQDRTRLSRDWHSIRWPSLLRAGLEDAGFLLFLIVIGAVMEHYGIFLNWLLGGFGILEASVLEIDMTQGVFGFFLPEPGFGDALSLTLAAGAFAFGLWNQSRPQEIRIDGDRVRWRAANRSTHSIPTATIAGLLLLYEPRPLLILVGDDRSLILDCIANPVELDELYAKLLEALAPFGILTAEHQDRLHAEQIRLSESPSIPR